MTNVRVRVQIWTEDDNLLEATAYVDPQTIEESTLGRKAEIYHAGIRCVDALVELA